MIGASCWLLAALFAGWLHTEAVAVPRSSSSSGRSSGSESKRRRHNTTKNAGGHSAEKKRSDHLSISVFPQENGHFKKEMLCKYDETSRTAANLADVLAHCAGQLGLKAVKVDEWRFLEIEDRSMILNRYDKTKKAPILAHKIKEGKVSRVEFWQWKNVSVTVQYERLEWNEPIISEMISFADGTRLNPTLLWRIPFPDSIMEARDIEAFVYNSDTPAKQREFSIADGKPMFLLRAALDVGEPLTLLLREKKQECPISREDLLMDRNLVKKTACKQRFLMSEWYKWLGPCPLCKVEICDRCEERINGTMKKFMCGHVFHQDCNSSAECTACNALFLEVKLPSNQRRFYEIKNRYSAASGAITPATIFEHFLGPDAIRDRRLSAAFIRNDERVELTMDSHLMAYREWLRANDPFDIEFDTGTKVVFRLSNKFGNIAKTVTVRVKEDREIIADYVKLLKPSRIGAIFKCKSAGSDLHFGEIFGGLNARILKAIAGYENPVIEIVEPSEIAFLIADRQRKCELNLHSFDRIAIAEVLTRCVNQINTSINEPAERLSKNRNEWTFRTSDTVELEIYGHEEYYSGSINALTFVWRQTSADSRNQTGVVTDKDGRQSVEVRLIMETDAAFSRYYTCRIPVDEQAEHQTLVRACWETMSARIGLNGRGIRLSLERHDGLHHGCPRGTPLIREWRRHPGMRIVGRFVKAP